MRVSSAIVGSSAIEENAPTVTFGKTTKQAITKAYLQQTYAGNAVFHATEAPVKGATHAPKPKARHHAENVPNRVRSDERSKGPFPPGTVVEHPTFGECVSHGTPDGGKSTDFQVKGRKKKLRLRNDIAQRICRTLETTA